MELSACICCRHCRSSKANAGNTSQAVITSSYYRRRSVSHFLQSVMLHFRRHAALMCCGQMFFVFCFFRENRKDSIVFLALLGSVICPPPLFLFFYWSKGHFFPQKTKGHISVFLSTPMCIDVNETWGVCLSHHRTSWDCEMNHVAFWHSLTPSVCNSVLVVSNSFKVLFPFHLSNKTSDITNPDPLKTAEKKNYSK